MLDELDEFLGSPEGIDKVLNEQSALINDIYVLAQKIGEKLPKFDDRKLSDSFKQIYSDHDLNTFISQLYVNLEQLDKAIDASGQIPSTIEAAKTRIRVEVDIIISKARESYKKRRELEAVSKIPEVVKILELAKELKQQRDINGPTMSDKFDELSDALQVLDQGKFKINPLCTPFQTRMVMALVRKVLTDEDIIFDQIPYETNEERKAELIGKNLKLEASLDEINQIIERYPDLVRSVATIGEKVKMVGKHLPINTPRERILKISNNGQESGFLNVIIKGINSDIENEILGFLKPKEKTKEIEDGAAEAVTAAIRTRFYNSIYQILQDRRNSNEGHLS